MLDLARALFSKQQDDDLAKLKLADTYIALGDVSLETGIVILVLLIILTHDFNC